MKNILYTILLISLLGCSKDIKDIKKHPFSSKEYTIKKGNHSANGINIKSHKSRTDFAFACTLDQSCYYDLGNNNNMDINKIYGLTWGLDPLNNSFRIGWNCYRQNGLIQYFYYTHNYKIRNPGPADAYDKTLLFELPPNTRVSFAMELLRYPGTIRIHIEGMPNVFDVPFDFNGVPLTGFFNYPYFGGDEGAPHTMKLTLETN